MMAEGGMVDDEEGGSVAPDDNETEYTHQDGAAGGQGGGSAEDFLLARNGGNGQGQQHAQPYGQGGLHTPSMGHTGGGFGNAQEDGWNDSTQWDQKESSHGDVPPYSDRKSFFFLCFLVSELRVYF